MIVNRINLLPTEFIKSYTVLSHGHRDSQSNKDFNKGLYDNHPSIRFY